MSAHAQRIVRCAAQQIENMILLLNQRRFDLALAEVHD